MSTSAKYLKAVAGKFLEYHADIRFIAITMTLRDFQQDFNKNFSKISNLLEEIATDFTEQMDSSRLKQNLNSALDVLRSFSRCLGFRVSLLNARNIEVIVPRKARVLENGNYSEGALIAVGIEAARLLWQRNGPNNARDFQVQAASWKLLKDIKSEVVVRIELSELARETALAELSKNQKSFLELQAQYFDADQLAAQLAMEISLTSGEFLEWK